MTMKPSLNTTKEINAMQSALVSAGVFTIDRTPESIVVIHTKSGKEVLRSLKKSNCDAWITRAHPNLWA